MSSSQKKATVFDSVSTGLISDIKFTETKNSNGRKKFHRTKAPIFPEAVLAKKKKKKNSVRTQSNLKEKNNPEWFIKFPLNSVPRGTPNTMVYFLKMDPFFK